MYVVPSKSFQTFFVQVFKIVVDSWKFSITCTQQDTYCTATCLLSRKLFKLNEPDMQNTAGEAGTNS